MKVYCSVGCRDTNRNARVRDRNVCKIKPVLSFAYITLIIENGTPLGLKFGVESRIKSRLWKQQRTCPFSLERHCTYAFEEREDAMLAESMCKLKLTCGILPKDDMPDGYTETTYCYNIEAIEAIYRKHGGVKI